MKYNILTIGYYNKNNLGDEFFKISLKKLFSNSNITFINPHNTLIIKDEYDMIFFGAGNVMNYYFIDRLKLLLLNNKWMYLKPLIGFGVGFESKYMFEELKYFDFICTRTKDDMTLYNLHRYFNMNNLMCIPDIVFALNTNKNIRQGNKTIIIPSYDRIKDVRKIKDKIYILDLEKDKILSKNTIQNLEEFEEAIKDVLFVVSFKFHGLVLSIIYNRIPIIDMKSFKCNDLMRSIFDENISKNLMFNSSSEDVLQEIENCKTYAKNNQTLIDKKIKEYLAYTDLFYLKWNEEYISDIFFRSKNKMIREYIDYHSVSELMHDLKLGSNSPYKWGLEEKKQILKEHVEWLEEDIYKKKLTQRPYNIEVFDQSFNNSTHRWGWNYVLRSIQGISSKYGIYLDTYLDSSYNEKGYSVPWVGIIHHPDNIPKEYSEANLSRIFKSNFWKLSKPHCKKLIILSNYVREQATKYVDSSLLVTLYHPMNQCLDKWDYDKWKLDGEKIYSIGNWLRNEFAIYQLNYKKKYKIYTKDTSPPENIYIYTISDLEKDLNEFKENKKLGCYNSNLKNKWVYFVNEYLKKYNLILKTEEQKNKKRDIYMETKIKEMINSVTLCDRKSDEEYDELLTNSIILLDLIDCSACNVLLECIISEVPIYVKRHPAIEEYIGEEYPLFYTEIENVKITTSDVKKGNKYLKSLNKQKFTSDYFINGLLKISESIKSEMKR
jgi:hypothetical protein